MKIFKIIIGFFLLYGTGKESIHLLRSQGGETSGMLLSLLIMLPFVFLCAWLIGSGFSARKLKIKSLEFLKYFIFSLVLFCLIAFIELSSLVIPTNYQKINGMDIPLSKCMDGSKNLITDEKQRREFCICLADKISSSKLKEKYIDDIRSGNFDAIINKSKEEGNTFELNLESCITNTKDLEWTDKLGQVILNKMKSELKGTEIEFIVDVDSYCNCLLDKFKKYPLSKIYDESFYETEEYKEIESDCLEKSKLNNL